MGDSPPSEARSNCSTPSCNAPAWLGVFFVTHFISKRHDMPWPNHCSAWLVLAGQWQWNQRRMRRLSGWILASSSAKLSLQPRSKMSVEPGMTKRKKLDLQGFGHPLFLYNLGKVSMYHLDIFRLSVGCGPFCIPWSMCDILWIESGLCTMRPGCYCEHTTQDWLACLWAGM